MNLTFKRVRPGSRTFRQVGRLYRSAFPPVERIPLWLLALSAARPGFDFYAVRDGEGFCGLLYLVSDADNTLIFYFAVRDDLRGRGYGAEILSQLMGRRESVSLIMESVYEPSDNAAQRLRRKEFYLRNGFCDTGYCMKDSAGVFDILSTREHIDAEAIRKLICRVLFWKRTDVSVGKIRP